MFSRLFKWLRYGTNPILPTAYDPKLHYNCFIEAAPSELRKDLYNELLKRGHISASDYLSDGRIQLIVSNLYDGIEALNTIAKDKNTTTYDAFKLSLAEVLKLMMNDSDLELAFVWKVKSGGTMLRAITFRRSS
jgi:hypothetical protein